MEYVDRSYRHNFRQEDLVHFQVTYQETDLDIGVPMLLYSPKLVQGAQRIVLTLRKELEQYILRDPQFATSLKPYQTAPEAPLIAVEMAKAARLGEVGPMAAVAGAFAQFTATTLFGESNTDIIIENGGDIYLRTSVERRIGIFAGLSPLSNKLALVIHPQQSPVGICTSSGTVGPSLSFGKADAAVIISSSALLADAVATATGNLIKGPEDLEKAVDWASTIPGITGAVIIAGDRIAAWGQVELAPI